MIGLEFTKMSGHGNDFILVDNWDGQVGQADMPGLTKAVCRRHLGVGADGMVFIEAGPDEVDFAWRFFNSDGSEAEMCGNAGRCAARFAYINGIAPAEMQFMTRAGIIQAQVGPDTVRIQMTRPGPAEMDCTLDLEEGPLTFCAMNTGVPHMVTWVDDIEAARVQEMGRVIRFHPRFQPAGANANFAQIQARDHMAVRTYERGVEDETLACGTGCVASVLLAALQGRVDSPTRVLTRGGEDLIVHFTLKDGEFEEVFLEGPVRVICTGRLGLDALL
ncbi:MAG: diaminopimelate epimerase [Proteobacteria bacterium]|nr:diaminopimelate epimerase [Pseudomonadota bacterium]